MGVRRCDAPVLEHREIRDLNTFAAAQRLCSFGPNDRAVRLARLGRVISRRLSGLPRKFVLWRGVIEDMMRAGDLA